MSKRNFILLTIVLFIILVAFLAIIFKQPAPGEEGEGTNFLSQFNPFGNRGNNNTDNQPPPVDVSGYQPPPEEKSSGLKRVSSMPVAGYAVFQKERFKEVPPPPPGEESVDAKIPAPPGTEFAPAIRYVDRANGNIYQTFADELEERKFSGTTIPRVYEAFFGNKGGDVIMRYLKPDGRTIQTFWGILPKEVLGGDIAGEMTVKGTFLPENITDLSLSADTSSIFYVFDTGDIAIGTTLELSTGKRLQVFESPFTEWLSSWPNSKTITMNTKPSYAVPGYAYKLDPAARSLSQVIGGITGLTTLTSPDGNLMLYADNDLSLNVVNTDTKETRSLGVRTMPEKCVWSKSSASLYCSVPKSLSASSYPDSWYQGESSFEDQIWRIDLDTLASSIVANLSVLNGGEEIDGIKLGLDEEENYLFFVNKKDSFLWELDLF